MEMLNESIIIDNIELRKIATDIIYFKNSLLIKYKSESY